MRDYLNISMGRLQVLVPASETPATRVLEDTFTERVNGRDIQVIEEGGSSLPVLLADDDLNLTALEEKRGGTCVCLVAGGTRFALVCDEVSVVEASDLVLHDLPVCMIGRDSPLTGLAVSGTTIYCVTDTGRLAQAWSGHEEKDST